MAEESLKLHHYFSDLFLTAQCFENDCRKSKKRADYCCSRKFNHVCCQFQTYHHSSKQARDSETYAFPATYISCLTLFTPSFPLSQTTLTTTQGPSTLERPGHHSTLGQLGCTRQLLTQLTSTSPHIPTSLTLLLPFRLALPEVPNLAMTYFFHNFLGGILLQRNLFLGNVGN